MRWLFYLVIFITFGFIFPSNVYAGEVFETRANVEYKIQQNGLTAVTNTISIKNITSEFFSKTYILNLNGVNPKNLKAVEAGRELPVFSEETDGSQSIRIEFPEVVAGKGKLRSFVITYEEDSFAEKTGEVWEISIPKLTGSENYEEFNVTVSIPDYFGEEAYISPEPRAVRSEDQRRIYLFQKEDIDKIGITAGFGKFQVFSFTLNYHLENPSNEKIISKVALPPDTSTQEVRYEKLDPPPTNVLVDEDGNWLAVYNLSPRQKVDVKLSGSASIFAKPRKLLSPTPGSLLTNLKPTQYWQSDDPEIHELAKHLETAQNMYNYITENLEYNYWRVKPNVNRLGAKSALTDPKNAICMEFTDLFIALARANGIPAREINGYAYSENPDIQPLSLVADVLHAWPEYWDKETATWIPIDPTWGTTSGGDFFTKLDLRHFAFVIHGASPTEPVSPGSYKLGENPQKDIFVSLGESREKSHSDIAIKVSYPRRFELFKRTADIEVVNTGGAAIYDVTTQILFDETSVYSDYFPVLPPYGKVEKQIEIPLGIFGAKSPQSARVLAYRSEKSLSTHKTEAVIYQIVLLSVILIGATFYASYKMGKGEFLKRMYAKYRKSKNS